MLCKKVSRVREMHVCVCVCMPVCVCVCVRVRVKPGIYKASDDTNEININNINIDTY